MQKLRILIIRNDKLGDFVLSLPVFKLIKQSMPEVKIHALVPNYTYEIAKVCDSIDDVIIDPGSTATLKNQLKLLNQVRKQNYDVVITLFSTTRIGLLMWLARIPYRLAPATKIAQLFYNHRLKQVRSRSEKPEYVYNLDLASHYLQHAGARNIILPAPPYLHFDAGEVSAIKNEFLAKNQIRIDHQIIIIHPGSGGSANNLSIEQYTYLIRELKPAKKYLFVITAGPDEFEYAQHLSNELSDIQHLLYHSTQGLLNFAKFLQSASLFISGSTGPLHLAGALDTPTAAFYPRRRSATSLRWQTLNSEKNRLAFMPPTSAEQENMRAIDISIAANEIRRFFSLTQ
jgi:ADP-heptose:LPS heptosyltransferase